MPQEAIQKSHEDCDTHKWWSSVESRIDKAEKNRKLMEYVKLEIETMILDANRTNEIPIADAVLFHLTLEVVSAG